MRTKGAAWLAASIMGVFSSAFAADSKGMYQTLHYISCKDYSEFRKEPVGTGNNALSQIYISGWLSGYNYLTPNTFNILRDESLDGVMRWMDGFCTKNPAKNVEAGLLQLTAELYPERLQNYQKPASPEDNADPLVKATSSSSGRKESKFNVFSKSATPTANATGTAKKR